MLKNRHVGILSESKLALFTTVEELVVSHRKTLFTGLSLVSVASPVDRWRTILFVWVFGVGSFR